MKEMRCTFICSTLMTMTVSTTVVASENNLQTLEPLIIKTTRYKQDITKIPGTVQVISSRELKKQITISDDLTSVVANLVPSMTPSRQKLSNQGENLRGRTALYLVDAVPQNNPLRNGNRYGHTVDSFMIDNIEVVNGASAAYGEGSTGGIISYKTKTAQPGDHWKQTIGTRINSNFNEDGTGEKIYYRLSHFDKNYDLMFASSLNNQGLYYDGNKKPIGINATQGETQDSKSLDLFLKAGYNFNNQRIQASINNYVLKSKNNYAAVKGDYKKDIPGTVRSGYIKGEPISNKVTAYILNYENYDFLNGELNLQIFHQKFAALYGPYDWYITKEQALNNKKVTDQSAIESTKTGFKLSYAYKNLLNRDDNWLVGLDGLSDNTAQLLNESRKNYTPDMAYRELSPFVQGDFLLTDNLRLSGGVRLANVQVEVDNYTTIANSGADKYGEDHIVGGKRNFQQALANAGALYNFTPSFSVYAAFSQGFGMPDIGRTLRGKWIKAPDPNSGEAPKDIYFETMPAVKPVITNNYELGINYQNDIWFLKASTYKSIAKDGANLSLTTDGVYNVERQRTDINGLEFLAKYNITRSTDIQTMYSQVRGRVDSTQDGKVDSDVDLKNIAPDRLMIAMHHNFTPELSGMIQMNKLFDRTNEKKKQNFTGYSTIDLSTHYDTGTLGRVSLGVENITNKQYINYFSQVRNSDSYFFSGRGRTYSLGYEIDF